MSRENKNNCFVFLFLFIALTAILFFAPHTVDDNYYDYLNMKNFADILKFSAGYGNGRVLGNMLAVYLCKSRALAAVVRGLSITYISYLIPKAVDSKIRSSALICVSLLLVGVGSLAFGEVYSWISAFSNYFPPIICILVCIIEIRKNLDNSNSAFSSFVLIFILGFIGQLFTENSAVNNLAISFFLLILFAVKKERIKYPLILFISTSLGAATMLGLRLFCHDVRGLYNTVNYGVQFDSVSSVIYSCINNYISFSKWTSQWIILFFIIQIELFFVLKYSKSPKGVLNMIKFPILGCTFLHLLLLVIHVFIDNMFIKAAILVTFSLYLICLVLLSFFINKEIKRYYQFVLLFAFFTASYLLILNPINPRILYYTYIVLTCLVLILLPYVTENISEKVMKPLFLIPKGILGVMSIVILIIHINIYNMNKRVNDFVKLQIESGENQVYVCPVTETYYFHHSFTNSRLGRTYYKNEPFDVKFIDVDIDEWEKIYEEWNGKD